MAKNINLKEEEEEYESVYSTGFDPDANEKTAFEEHIEKLRYDVEMIQKQQDEAYQQWEEENEKRKKNTRSKTNKERETEEDKEKRTDAEIKKKRKEKQDLQSYYNETEEADTKQPEEEKGKQPEETKGKQPKETKDKSDNSEAQGIKWVKETLKYRASNKDVNAILKLYDAAKSESEKVSALNIITASIKDGPEGDTKGITARFYDAFSGIANKNEFDEERKAKSATIISEIINGLHGDRAKTINAPYLEKDDYVEFIHGAKLLQKLMDNEGKKKIRNAINNCWKSIPNIKKENDLGDEDFPSEWSKTAAEAVKNAKAVMEEKAGVEPESFVIIKTVRDKDQPYKFTCYLVDSTEHPEVLSQKSNAELKALLKHLKEVTAARITITDSNISNPDFEEENITAEIDEKYKERYKIDEKRDLDEDKAKSEEEKLEEEKKKAEEELKKKQEESKDGEGKTESESIKKDIEDIYDYGMASKDSFAIKRARKGLEKVSEAIKGIDSRDNLKSQLKWENAAFATAEARAMTCIQTSERSLSQADAMMRKLNNMRQSYIVKNFQRINKLHRFGVINTPLDQIRLTPKQIGEIAAMDAKVKLLIERSEAELGMAARVNRDIEAKATEIKEIHDNYCVETTTLDEAIEKVMENRKKSSEMVDNTEKHKSNYNKNVPDEIQERSFR